MHLSRRRRLHWSRAVFFLCGVLICCVYQLTLRSRHSEPWLERQIEDKPGTADSVLKSDQQELTVTTQQAVEHPTEKTTTSVIEVPPVMTSAPPLMTTNHTNLKHCVYVDPEPPKPTMPIQSPTPYTTHAPNTTAPSSGSAPRVKGEYPEDLFSVDQRRQGWVVLHLFGMIYMFVSLAIVCDEFFVPALGVITDKLEISDDVAGATFMAAGGSAPELFTSLIGVFIAHSNVGIGTIVGSAVFNILFVIGMCALFSREILHLTWWPLFRDVSFYIMDLILLIIFFLDSTIMWWESILLVLAYLSYVWFMKYNVQLENAFKTQLNKHKNIVKAIALEEPEKDDGTPGGDNLPDHPEDKKRLKPKPSLQRGGSSASLHNSTMRNTIFQLMIHTLDPLGEVKFKDKAEMLNKMARGKVESKARGRAEDGAAEASTSQPAAKEEGKEIQEQKDREGADGGGSEESSDEDSSDEDSDDDSEDDEDLENEEPLSLEWPDTRRKQATYLFLLPIIFPLWLTLPDMRNLASKKYFVVTFLGSIIWIAVFSYLMVWWAHQVGETIGISEEIMGLTILAAGTSIPDLITSVIVARKGLGDMAVSSSVGSNIFDITMGLPLPWLMFSLFNGLVPVAVSSNGLFCAIVLLFLMLLFVIVSIAACKWKMSKRLGFTMFLLYFVFLVLSVMLEDRIIVCPVSI
ncbi:sodium/potassium/calcium exchanger 1 isoform X2 [Paramormyrops kingsleyae]|uniref:sodium/potassium/calcium exchanger 1 isoform X2 n=1 Tax=Paramormyrops kingsleyae TaxID=1676925 RepID=UPI000CD63552|nr:sodium/potassium/calcium exchanger 1-like isoform X2 [Paramormyrops kingsleyae]